MRAREWEEREREREPFIGLSFDLLTISLRLIRSCDVERLNLTPKIALGEEGKGREREFPPLFIL